MNNLQYTQLRKQFISSSDDVNVHFSHSESQFSWITWNVLITTPVLFRKMNLIEIWSLSKIHNADRPVDSWTGMGGGMDSQFKVLSELLSDQAAFITSPKTSLANYWGHCPPLPPQCLRAWTQKGSFSENILRIVFKQ